MKHLQGLTLSLCLVASCHGEDPAPSASDGSESATGDGSSTDGGSSTSDTADDTSSPECGDEVVDGLEECEPGGPVPCEEDCTLPPDGPGSIEWIFVDDVEGRALGLAVDEAGRATVVGEHSYAINENDDDVNAWIGRFEADGTPGWQVDVDGPDGDRATAVDVGLDTNGRAIVAGRVKSVETSAWIAAYDLDGVQLWARTETPPDGYTSSASAVTLLADQIYVGMNFAINGVENYPEPSLMVLAGDGTLLTTRTWAANDTTSIWSLVADPVLGRLVLVGAWDGGNWVEALDSSSQTIWTANEPVEAMPGIGTAVVIDAAVDAEGSIYLAGREEDFGRGPFSEGNVTYVRKLSSDGDANWAVLPSAWAHPAITIADGTVYTVEAALEEPDDAMLVLRAFDAESGALQWQRFHIPGDGGTGIYDVGANLESLWVVGARVPFLDDLNLDSYPYVARFRR